MRSKIVSAHQPNFLPYLGFFDKMNSSDIFVIRDEVLYVKKEYHNRNKIRINAHDNLNSPQSKWISAPVDDPKDFIRHAKIKTDAKTKNKLWHEQLLHEIESSYIKTPFFSNYFPEIKKIFSNNEDSLLSLNLKIINFLKSVFNLKTQIVLASELNLKPNNYSPSDASQDLANICKALNADIYLSGAGGNGYLTLQPFDKINVKVEFQDYKHPTYQQNFPGFLPYMSAIDALFCTGRMPQ